jgi:phenylacetate-coenzyme A ligase PaaK-like adenylate-forming protein
VDTFQVIQEAPDSMRLRVVPTAKFHKGTAGEIVARLQERGAADLEIEIEIVKEIPVANSGKRRFVISKLPRPFSRP